LCSDGLSPIVSDPAILEVLAGTTAPEAAVRELVALAEAEGAPDNISVIVIDVREGSGTVTVPPVMLGSAAPALTR
jgi:protein phosphatase